MVFVKYPQRGKVKTRLARDLGDTVAVGIYRDLVEYLLGMLRRVDAAEVRICFDPREKQDKIIDWLRTVWQVAGVGGPKLVFRPQCGGDLGMRLGAAFDEVFQEHGTAGRLKALVIGSDCIEIDGEVLQRSWDVLESRDVVFGPAADGGYYLLGMKSPHQGLFVNIPWSTDKALEVSLQRAGDAGLAVAMLDEKQDIDTVEDWCQFAKMFPGGAIEQKDGQRQGAE